MLSSEAEFGALAGMTGRSATSVSKRVSAPAGERMRHLLRLVVALVALAALTALATGPLMAQPAERVDPDDVYSQPPANEPIDGDLDPWADPRSPRTGPAPAEPQTDPWGAPEDADPAPSQNTAPEWTDPAAPQSALPPPSVPEATSATYGEDDLIGAAEGLFGKGAEGLARMIEDLLRKQGEPNGYIVGREAGGAFVFGARYGSGTLHHRIEGQRPVYWTGPSLGFDAGANAANTFVLVYNLYDSEDLYRRYPAGEGQAYFVGGLHASYMRRGDVVLIPIRMGAGLRLGVNAGYMRFSKKQRWLPF